MLSFNMSGTALNFGMASHSSVTNSVAISNSMAVGLSSNPVWLRLTYDGTLCKGFWSPDGINFYIVKSENKINDFTTAPDQIGYYVNQSVAAPSDHITPNAISILSWKIE
jgi:hypothetical protein